MKETTYHKLKAQFLAPPAEVRSVPFWAWNDKLDKDEIRRQIKEMKAQGMGGFFMHSRDGLETVYMGPEWMECVREAVKTAEEEGMYAWLYDEDRWPSGFAGGLVQARGGDAFRAKGLTLEIRQDEPDSYDDVVALYKAEIDGFSIHRFERLPVGGPVALQAGWVLLVYRIEVSEKSEWFNNEAPPDQLNPETVRAFIELTYEAYKREVGDQFGKTIRGVFTDEPSVHDRHCKFTEGRGWLPWSYAFADFFRERRGYDVFDVVPYLFFDGEHSAAARHDYNRTLMERFSEAYSKQIGEWCEQNGIAFTGHYLWENNLGTATRVMGAAMPNYRYQHIPGIDMLNEQTDETITCKQCTSVANQYGRKYVLTETYGCTGWGFTFEGQKWIGDFQYVMGVNLRSQHLALYSIRGCRKRDYPPVFNYNTSWWKYNHVVEDYFARLSAVLTEGRAVRDVLVLHPASTGWCMRGTSPYGFAARGKDRGNTEVNEIGNAFNRFLRDLLGLHYDLDIGDETIMAEAGSVNGNRLKIQLAEYKAVVLPPIATMFQSTFELLMRFMDAGGRVVAAGEQATMIEGRPSDRLQALYQHPNMTLVRDVQEVAEALATWLPRRVSIRNSRGEEARELLYMLREIDGGHALFVVNNDRDNSHEVTIDVEANGVVEEWDPLTGKIKPAAFEATGNRLRLRAKFGPAGSKLYMIRHVEQGASPVIPTRVKEPSRRLVATLAQPDRFQRTMPNVLTLDQCTYRYGDRGWTDTPTDVWQAQRDIREALGMRQVYGNGILQRYKWIYEPHPRDGTPAAFRFVFHVADVPEKDVYLVVENAEDYAITLNGRKVSNQPEGWFLDRAFDIVRLPRLQSGENELILSCAYSNRMEVEDIYLVGDFGVSPERVIVAEPQNLKLGDWCNQGYKHYIGSLVYQYDVLIEDISSPNRYILELGEYSATTVEVRVNGQTAGHIPWRAANGLDVTDCLKHGVNRVEIEVMSSPRNMLGPFHRVGGDPGSTNWASFRVTGDSYTPDYNVRPYGLMTEAKLYALSG